MMKIAHCSMLASLLFLFLSSVSCFPMDMETQQKQQQEEKHDGKNSTDALRRRPAPPPTDANNTKPSPTNESQTMEKTVESGNGSSAAAAVAGPRIPLTPAEAQARIFGQNPNATAEEVQKQIQDLSRVRDLLAEYNRKVKQLAAQRGQQLEPTPSNEEFKRRRKVKALQQARLAAGDKTIPEQQNEHLKEYLFQGDILLTVEEAEALVRELDSQLKLLL